MSRDVQMTEHRSVTFQKGCSTTSARFPDNKVKTSKYTPLTFLPLNLYEQLHKFGNVYFLSISILMYLGEKTTLFVGTIKCASTLATLLAMMALTAVMAALDDRRRSLADEETNNQKVCWVANKSFGEKRWAEIRVGDMLKIVQDDELPADLVLLYCSGHEGTCYVSTANLDGEANLKLKFTPPAAQKALGGDRLEFKEVLHRLGELTGRVDTEAPKASIHEFNGRLQLSTPWQEDEPLGAKNLLLRGTKLRNTAWCIGLVVYTGPDTRMVMNSREVPLKQSNLDRSINSVMRVVLLAQAIMALISDVLFLTNQDTFRHQSCWYLYPPDIILPTPIGYWLTFFVLYSNLMPISLYPTMEVCNAAQSYFIKNDEQMLHRDRDAGQAVLAGVKSSNLCQELGQVNYIFSDKTGTLTQNVMELKRLLINNNTYGTLQNGVKGFNGGDELTRAWEGGDQHIDQFLQVLAVAHTVIVSKVDAGVRFEAESPDESALVEAVARLGWVFTGARAQTKLVRVRGEQQEYTVLATNQFDSTRKRMSVLVQHKQQYFLFCKGADNVMLEGHRAASRPPKLEEHLTHFAQEGLRTLVVARRTLERSYAEAWLSRFREAERQLEGRDVALAQVAEELEAGMEIVGATAIEDKLQEGVPETIQKIRAAGIRLWVLTGDKLETARNIGFSSKVLTSQMLIEVLDRIVSSKQVKEDLAAQSHRLRRAASAGHSAALMITGAALEAIEADQTMGANFLEMAEVCSIVIACRVSPLQKAHLVRLVREGLEATPVTLAIGDGANDVPMIQEAQVGVGIAGKEGRQAMNNADFSIGQFQCLQRLLFVHGRWNYRRVCKFTLFTFWRNAVQVLIIWGYTLISGFSGTSLFEDWIRMSFNFLCSFPIMATGCIDQDVDESTALGHPDLYVVGRKGWDLNARKIAQSLASALVHSLIVMVISRAAFPGMDLLQAGDYYTFGTAVYSFLLVDMNYRVAFLNYTHNRFTVGSIVMSFLLYAVYLVVYPCCKPIADMLAPNMYMVPYHMVSVPTFWVCILVVPATSLIVDMFVHTVYARFCDPMIAHIQDLRAATRKEVDHPYCPLCSQDSGSSSASQSEEESSLSFELDTSRFAQQRCTGVFLRTEGPSNCVSTLLVGFAVLAVGWWCLTESHASRQIRVHYYDSLPERRQPVDPAGTLRDEVFDRREQCSRNDTGATECRVTVTVPRSMKGRILVYYAVGPFYQNFNDYLKSEVAKELMGYDVGNGTRESLCVRPTRTDDKGQPIVPCGMKATSVFNDTFEVEGIDISEERIAWKSDVDRYNNPRSYKRESVSWLYERYPHIVSEKLGVKDERFAAWMRPSAMPHVLNSYGWLQSELQAGQNLTIHITSNFPAPLRGYKQLVLTTVGPLGGRHDSFGILLMGIGAVCCLLAGTRWAILQLRGVSDAVRVSGSGSEGQDFSDSDQDSSE